MFTTNDGKFTVKAANAVEFPSHNSAKNRGRYEDYKGVELACKNNVTGRPFTLTLRMPQHSYDYIERANAEQIIETLAGIIDDALSPIVRVGDAATHKS